MEEQERTKENRQPA